MSVVSVHKFTSNYSREELDGRVEFIENTLPDRLAKAPARQGRFFFSNVRSACWAHFVGDHSLARRFMNVAFDCAAAVFAAAHAEQTVTFELEGQRVSGPGGPPDHSANEGVWIEAFLLGLALQREGELQVFVDYPTDRLGEGPGEGDEFRAPMVDALKAFLTENEAWPTFRDRALALSEPGRLTVMTPRQAEPYRAVLRALEPVSAADQAGFNDALVAVLKAHKALFGRGKESRGPRSLLSVPACGVAGLAIRSGLDVEVESGYLPAWLLEAP